MTEAFLHYVWQLQYFDKVDLTTSSGEPVRVLHPGTRNTNAGPDFSEARLKIGELEWRGSVEIHIKASGWNDHKHSADHAYENVVLHVVWQNDKPVRRINGSEIPTLELSNRIDPQLFLRYKDLYTSAAVIPCASHWQSVPDLDKFSMLDRALAQRVETKARRIAELLEKAQHDWEQVCYQVLCRNFGFKINEESMGRVSEILPYKIIQKHVDNPHQVEALLFGVSGFLDKEVNDGYAVLLKREYAVLCRKYGLQAKQLSRVQWKFMRLRPANFPTVRLAQLAAVLTRQRHVFSNIRESKTYTGLYEMLRAAQSPYWQRHYLFGKTANARVATLGESSIQNIIMNTVAPLLVAYGKCQDEQAYVDFAIELLQHLPAEHNKITRQWEPLGWRVKTGFDSQALIQLYHNFCSKHRCLECTVGSYLIKS